MFIERSCRRHERESAGGEAPSIDQRAAFQIEIRGVCEVSRRQKCNLQQRAAARSISDDSRESNGSRAIISRYVRRHVGERS